MALAFEPAAAPLPAGRLAMQDGLAQMEWSGDVIAQRLPVSPVFYAPEAGLTAARGRTFDGLHGFLSDSLPDSWGHRLMRRRLAKLGIDIDGLTPLDRLALVGDQGRGALVFEPATTPADAIESLDLDALAHDATALLMGNDSALADTLAGLAGGSGGARPKPSKLTVVAQGGEALAWRLDAGMSRRPARRQPFDIAFCDLQRRGINGP
jgi:serine/threonine-protein kinase HipA